MSESISIYPNPASDIIQFTGINIGAQIKLIDMQHRVVLDQIMKDNTLDIVFINKWCI